MKLALSCMVLSVALASAASGQAKKCQPVPQQTADQETYAGLTDRVYVYVPRIESAGAGGWKPFTLRILVGSFRRPFLLPKGFMKEADLLKLLSGRPDIKQFFLNVPGSDPRQQGPPPSLTASATVPDGNTSSKLTVRASRVVAAKYGSYSVVLDVCVTKS
jgi:hypothetical protein